LYLLLDDSNPTISRTARAVDKFTVTGPNRHIGMGPLAVYEW
jgi:hypothetical protein